MRIWLLLVVEERNDADICGGQLRSWPSGVHLKQSDVRRNVLFVGVTFQTLQMK